MDPIYRRTALFYRTLLRAGTQRKWTELMDSTEVSITVDREFATRPGAQRLLITLCVILARCFGTVTVNGDGFAAIALLVAPVLAPREGTLAEACRTIISSIQGTTYRHARPRRRIPIHIGPRPPRRAQQTVVASGWRAKLYAPRSAPRAFDGDPNPAGAVLAALLAATSVVRGFIEQVTTPSREIARTDGRMLVDRRLYERYAPPLGVQELSAYDLFSLGPEPEWSSADLGRLVFVSLGAVNGTFLFALLLADDLTAAIEVLEPQTVRRTDQNRYWYAIDAHRGHLKLTAARTLATGRVQIEGRSALLSASDVPFVEGVTVFSGADNDEARHLAQRLARGPLVSLSTEGEQVYASLHLRHKPPCAACVHPGGAVPGGILPTHPVVAGWAGLLGLQAMSAKPAWRAGRQIRVAAFRPNDRHDDWLEGRAGCPVCEEQRVDATA